MFPKPKPYCSFFSAAVAAHPAAVLLRCCFETQQQQQENSGTLITGWCDESALLPKNNKGEKSKTFLLGEA